MSESYNSEYTFLVGKEGSLGYHGEAKAMHLNLRLSLGCYLCKSWVGPSIRSWGIVSNGPEFPSLASEEG
jgi:hypothetical protein